MGSSSSCCKEVKNWQTEQDARNKCQISIHGYVHQYGDNIPIDVIRLIVAFYDLEFSFVDYDKIEEGEVIYDDDERGCFYNSIRVLWCKCFEPFHRITTNKIIIKKWHCCYKTIDVIPVIGIDDIMRKQNFCQCLFSCCCNCIHDLGALDLYGPHTEHNWMFQMNNISHSNQVFSTLVRHLQNTHKYSNRTQKLIQKSVPSWIKNKDT